MTMTGEGPDLGNGDSGDWVTELQRLLQALGHLHRDPDGTFGDETTQAVEEFQASVGQVADGKVGRNTWAALSEHAPELDPTEDAHDAPRGEPSAGQASEDGQWVWDGNRWVGAADGAPEPADPGSAPDGVGQLSEDRQWRWDGIEWQPASQ